MGAAAPDSPSSFERTAVSWKRSHACQCGHFFARQRPQLGQVGKECRDQDWSHTWHTPQDLFFLSPDRALANCHCKIGIRRGEFLLQPGDVGLHSFLNGPSCETQPVLFCREHLDQLASASHQGRENLRLLVGHDFEARDGGENNPMTPGFEGTVEVRR